MPELQSIVNDGTTILKEKRNDGSEINIIQRVNDPEFLGSEAELGAKKLQLSSIGFNIREMSKDDYKDGVGFIADKTIASDTVKRLSFAFKKKK